MKHFKQSKFLAFILIILLTMCTSVFVQAQEVLNEGVITMRTKDISGDLEEEKLKQMELVLNSTFTECHFNEEFNVVISRSFGEMQKTVIIDDVSSKNMEMYGEIMGEKWKVVLDKKEMDEDIKSAGLRYDIRKVEGDAQNILGYTCERYNVYEVENGDSKDPKFLLTMWLTDKINFQGSHLNMFPKDLRVEGVPLRYIVDQKGIRIKVEATELKKKFDKSILDFDKKQYQEKSEEEFLKYLRE